MAPGGSTPIICALDKYIKDSTVRFHMPGHKGGGNVHGAIHRLLGNSIFQADVTNVPGMDDLHQPHGVIQLAQQFAAKAFGADFTYFLVNGSSCGLQALITAVCDSGDKILVPRNIHRSILAGMIISGAVPVFFMPEYDDKYGIPLGTAPETICQALNDEPGVKAVLIVSPTYHGLVSDIAAIADVVHKHGIPLLVDEAHGAHLRFHSDLPEDSLACGADAVVHGTHKMLSALTQAAMLHIKQGRIKRDRLEAALKMLQSTSTSYLLLASLDAARAQMEHEGAQLIQHALGIADYARSKIGTIENIGVLGVEMIGRPGVYAVDPTKITLSVKEMQLSGLQVEQRLREEYHIQVEMSDLYTILLLISFGNKVNDVDSVVAALKAISTRTDCDSFCGSPGNWNINVFPDMPQMTMTPRQAFFAPNIMVPLEYATGRISTEVVACYPPGIPILCPGEKITRDIVEYLVFMRHLGVHFQGCFDPKLERICVVI